MLTEETLSSLSMMFSQSLSKQWNAELERLERNAI